MAMSMATATAPVTALADVVDTTGTESGTGAGESGSDETGSENGGTEGGSTGEMVVQQRLMHLPKTKALRLLMN